MNPDIPCLSSEIRSWCLRRELWIPTVSIGCVAILTSSLYSGVRECMFDGKVSIADIAATFYFESSLTLCCRMDTRMETECSA